MKSTLFTVLVILSTQAVIADQLVCTQPGNTNTLIGGGTCTLTGPPAFPPIDPGQPITPFQYNAIFGGGFSHGAFGAVDIAESLSIPDNISSASFPMAANATWDDVFTLPSSKPTDLLKITVIIQGLSGTPDVRVGPFPDLNYNTPCDFHVSQQFCTTTNTVSAAGINFVEVSGSLLFIVIAQDQGAPFSSNATDLFESVSIQRFLGDGTTPDPFTPTPEPSGLGLMAGFLIVTLGFWQFRLPKPL